MKEDIIEKLKNLCDYVSEDGLPLVDEIIAMVEKLPLFTEEEEFSDGG